MSLLTELAILYVGGRWLGVTWREIVGRLGLWVCPLSFCVSISLIYASENPS